MNKYFIGIDIGSTCAKTVVMNHEKEILHRFLQPTGWSSVDTANQIQELLREKGILPEESVVVATGYGRVSVPYAAKCVTEITCHARGAAFLNPSIRAIVDIGGQDCKAILLDNGLNVVDFIMNDKCAAGTGRFIEVMMRILEEDISNIDQFVEGHQPMNITSMCTVFAESEIVSLLAKGADKGDIALGIINSICRRTSFFAQKLNLSGDIFFSGGLAKFEIFRSTLEGYLKIPVHTSPLSQYAGAIGAAVIGYNKVNRTQI